MEKRRFGRTGHMSTVAIFGAVALGTVSQDEADWLMERVLAYGINHIDIAPSYGDAENRLGPWMPRIREQVFLGCKTTERSREGAAAEMQRSLQRLRVKAFDLYQLHAVTSMEELDQVTAPGGALEALIEARDQGLTRYLGITGHGFHAPRIFIEALNRFDFDSVLFPINFVQFANPEYRQNAEALLKLCQERNVGTMIIKSITKAPWGDHPHTYAPWYEPFDDPEWIQKAVNFVLSLPVTGICTVGDLNLAPKVFAAAANFQPMSADEREALIAQAGQFEPLFTP
jgi:aryl-alcohol dehydrogenase-like predicted oxidoreductase